MKEMNIHNINKELTQVPPRHLAEFLLPADLQVTTFKTMKTNLEEIKIDHKQNVQQKCLIC